MTPARRSTAASGSSPTVTLGLLLTVVVLSAGMQDCDGAKPVLLETYLRTPVRFVFADGAFAGRLLDWARTILATTLHIVRKPADPPKTRTREVGEKLRGLMSRVGNKATRASR